ncbi:polysaccharide biosynthesis tyrosine autokinase [Salinisphaera sp. SPP-AMP-43]|uniref:polysaccharide biosynthesis tyrosine autokinase n=1 Tax=Salinisphaera sp. SPP-AMP-43 TaxID=3121288 RepID=UPI003C6E1E28
MEQFDLRRLLAILAAGKWWIVGFTLAGILVAVVYLSITPYSYTVDSLVKIEGSEKSPLSGLVSQSSPLSALAGQSDAAESEIPIITSRDVLGQTVKELNLTNEASPILWPVIGSVLPSASNHIGIAHLEVPDKLVGQAFKLEVTANNGYILKTLTGQKILQGKPDSLASGRTPSGERITIKIQSVNASVGSQFKIVKQRWLSAVNGLKGKLSAAEVGSHSGILQLSMTGQDKYHVTKLLNSVTHNYIQQNVDAKSQDAAKSLKFLNSQLPKVRKKVSSAENRLAQYQEQNQPVDLSSESQALLQRESSLESRESQLKLEIAQLTQQYTEQYPQVQADRRQLSQISEQRKELQKKINKLPGSQKKILGLQRDVKVNTDLLTSLLNRAQELKLLEAGTIGNVRIIDPAVVPLSPTAPRPKLVVFVLAFLGLLIGISLVILRAALKRGISDPAELEYRTGYSVFAVVPLNRRRSQTARWRSSTAQLSILPRESDNEFAIEALRNLRTNVYFAQKEAESNVILMTGPAPGDSKSFVSLNLGCLLADTNQRVLLIDADMRRGQIHQALTHTGDGTGLSELLSSNAPTNQVIQRIEQTNLDVITSGAAPSNPSELLMQGRFKEVMEELQKEYDLIIIDAPPVLAVTDANIVAGFLKKVTTLFVLDSGKHPMAEIDEAIVRFTRQGSGIAGLVLTRHQVKRASAPHNRGHYQYAYSRSGT